MDPSDILRRIEAQTQFNYKVGQLSVTQPSANISTLTSEGTAILRYTSFAERQALALGKFYAQGGSTIGFGFIPNSLAPRLPQPVIFRRTFTYTGAAQEYILPNGAAYVDMWMWGAGGGGENQTFRGGSGAFVGGRYSTLNFTSLYIVVGTTGGGTIARGGGGAGNGGGFGDGNGGGGGGFSGVFKSNTLTQANLLACAGGGGGSGMWGRVGGGGGVTNGLAGTIGCANGGTQSAAGTGGGALQGGGAPSGGYGAGGGGYYGGGYNTNGFCGGGGGSSYIDLLTNPVSADGVTVADNGVGPANPGGTANSNYVSPYGRSGQNGYVVISVLAYQ